MIVDQIVNETMHRVVETIRGDAMDALQFVSDDAGLIMDAAESALLDAVAQVVADWRAAVLLAERVDASTVTLTDDQRNEVLGIIEAPGAV